MDYRDAEDWHRRTSRRPYPPAPLPVADYDWRPGGETTFDSLPYRRPKDLIQGPDEITSPHGRTRTSRTSSRAPATVVETMPTPATEAYRRGRFPVAAAYDYDSYGEDEPPSGARRMSLRRGRSPRSAQHSRPRRVYESRRSSTSSRSHTDTESDEESETSISTPDEKRPRRRDRDRERERGRRERDKHEKRPQRPVVEERRRTSREKKPKRRRKIREIVYVEEDDESTVHTTRQSVDERSSSPRHRSRVSRSASERQYSRQRSHSPIRRSSHHRPSPRTYEIVSKPPSSSKRHPKRKPSQVVYLEESRLVRRSNTVSGASHVTSHSTGSSNKRSSSFLGNLLTNGSVLPHSPEKPVKIVECVVCRDEFPSNKIAKLKCKHRMCESCLKDAFKLSVADLQHMPPRCCTSDHISLRHVERLLSPSFKMKWNRRFAEYSTRNRVYCPSRRCGEWIRPANIHRAEGGRKCGKCSRCNTKVCCSCRGKWHSSRECPNDEDTTMFLQQAKEAGWQPCYKCNHMVELKEGCNHMTCRCGAQFCMICGVKWKGCDCPWFNHETADADRLQDMQVPVALPQMDRLDLNPTSSSIRPSVGSGAPPPRSRSQDYDHRLSQRFQESRDEEHRGRLQSYQDDNVYDRGYGEIVTVGNTVGHFTNGDYRRDADDVFVSGPPVPPAPTPPAAFERPTPTDYMSGVNRARGVPQDTMGQRLAERFSEFRASPAGPRTGMMGPPPPHSGPPLSPMTAPLMGPPPMATAPPMGLGHPPQIPMLRRHTREEEVYNSARTTRPSERVVPGRIDHDYEMEAAVHAPRSRRRMHAEPPKSSTLAGLTGAGRGMNRVFEWRNHVEPGMPDESVLGQGIN